jgi:hypothetical protein
VLTALVLVPAMLVVTARRATHLPARDAA